MADDDDVLQVIDAVLRGVGDLPKHVEPLAGGWVNHTYRSPRVGADDVVLRFPVDPLRENEYPIECWAAGAAVRAGIPTARPLRHGVHGDVPFMVSEFVAPDLRPIRDPWTWLGRYARIIGSVDLRDAPSALYSRFGSNLAEAWAAHLEYNLASLQRDDPLRSDGAYASAAPLLSALETLATGEYAFGLAHGDLAPRNLISRGPDQAPVLIDWGAAGTGPTPWTDARRVFEWAVVDGSISRAEYDEFVAGAGVSSEADRSVLGAMTILHLLDVTRWAREKRPDLYGEYVERCRTGIERVLTDASSSQR